MTLRQHRQHGLEKTVAYLNERIKTLDALGNRYAWYRLITFLVGFGVGIPLYWVSEFAFWVIIISTIILFNIVAYQHRRVESSHKKHQIWLDIKSTQLARMRLDWDSIPQTSFRSDNFDHPFEADLDITGKKSIHQLINLAISHEGGELLRNWLLQQSPDLADIQQRQPVVKELSALSGFRDKLLLNFKWVSEEQLEGKKLLDWLKQPSASSALKWVLPLSTVLAIVNIGLFILYWVIQLSPFWVITLSIYVIIFFMNQGITKHLFKNATLLDEEFGKIKAIIKFLETYPYHKSSHLAGKCHPFWEATQSPSRYLKRMKRIVAAIGFRGNPLVWLLINLIGPYDFFLARSLNRYKSALKDRLPQWIHTWTELEALISLANMAWLNPQYSFPQVYANKQSPSDAILSAKQLEHPLIPVEEKVCNDFQLNQLGEIVIVTGSNMAGKSTFLKSIGINLALAYVGGPVDARLLQTSLFRLYTSIKVSDSITEGFSYFYAEVRRLKGLLNALQAEADTPLFFLIDEIFRGTNNRERFIGSRAYIRELADKNGVGIIATHDLELTHLAKQIDSVSNYHFREDVVDGKMAFDYRLRSGPCPTTNALVIMEMEGLPIDGGE